MSALNETHHKSGSQWGRYKVLPGREERELEAPSSPLRRARFEASKARADARTATPGPLLPRPRRHNLRVESDQSDDYRYTSSMRRRRHQRRRPCRCRSSRRNMLLRALHQPVAGFQPQFTSIQSEAQPWHKLEKSDQRQSDGPYNGCVLNDAQQRAPPKQLGRRRAAPPPRSRARGGGASPFPPLPYREPP